MQNEFQYSLDRRGKDFDNQPNGKYRTAGKSDIVKILYHNIIRSASSEASPTVLTQVDCRSGARLIREKSNDTRFDEEERMKKVREEIKELERKFNEISSGNIVFHDGKYEYKSTK